MILRKSQIQAKGAALFASLLLLTLSAACQKDVVELERELEVFWPPSGFQVNAADDEDPRSPGVQFSISLAGLNLEEASLDLKVLSGEIEDLSSATMEKGRAQLTFTLSAPVVVAAVAHIDELSVESSPLHLDFDPQLPACRITHPRTGSILGPDDNVAQPESMANPELAPAFASDVAVRCAGAEMGTPVLLSTNGGFLADAPLGPESIANFKGVELAEGSNLLQVKLSGPSANAPQPNREPASARQDSHSVVDVRTGACRLLLRPATSTVFNTSGEPPTEDLKGWKAAGNRSARAPMESRITVEHNCPGADIELHQVRLVPFDSAEPGDKEAPDAGSGEEGRAGENSGGSGGSDNSGDSGSGDSGNSGNSGSSDDSGNSNPDDGGSSSQDDDSSVSNDDENSDTDSGSGDSDSGSGDSGDSGSAGSGDQESEQSKTPRWKEELVQVLGRMGTGSSAEPVAFVVDLPEGEILLRARLVQGSRQQDEKPEEDDSEGSHFLIPPNPSPKPLANSDEDPSSPLRGVSPRHRYLVDSVQPRGRITFPLEGSVLDAKDDLATAPGLQTILRGDFEDIAPGSEYELHLDSESTGPWVRRGTLGANGSFAHELTLPNGNYRLRAQARRPSGNKAVSQEVRFTVAWTGASLLIESPADGEVLNQSHDASELPGYQLAFSLHAPNLENPAGRAGELRCGATRATFHLNAEGRAEALLSPQDLPCSGKTLRCQAIIPHQHGQILSKEIRIFVDAAPPSIRLLKPSPEAVLAEEEVSFEVLSDCPGEEQHLSLKLNGETRWTQPLLADGAIFGPLSLEEGSYETQVLGTDAAGNVGEESSRFEVRLRAPELVFIDPPQGELFAWGPGQNQGDPAQGFFRTIKVQVLGEADGTGVELHVGQQPPLLVAAVPSDEGAVATFTQVRLPEGDTLLRACAANLAGKVGCSEQAVRVVTKQPICNILHPTPGHHLGQKDRSAQVQNLPALEAVVQSSVPDGVQIKLELSDPAGHTSTLVAEAQDGLAEFEMVGLQGEGTWTAIATCALAPFSGQSLPHEFTVDTTPPQVEIQHPLDHAVFNLDSPDASAEPGFQVELLLSSNESEEGARLEYEVDCGAGLQSGSLDTFDSEGRARAIVSLPNEASCQVRARAIDVAENQSEWLSHHFIVDRVPPSFEILRPSDGTLFGSRHDADPSRPGFQLEDLAVQMDGARSTDPAWLLVNGNPAPAPQLSENGELATWTLLDLDEGPNELEITVLDEAENKASASIWVQVNTSPPELTIVSHVSGITLNRASDQDTSEPGMQQDIRLGGSDLVDGTLLRVCLDQVLAAPGDPQCASGHQLLASRVQSGSSSLLPRVTLPEGEIRFYAEAEDSLGNVGTSQTIHLRVDSIPPVVSELQIVQVIDGVEVELDTENGQAVFTAIHDSSPQPGFQTRLKARIEGIEPGNPDDPWRVATFVSSNPSAGTVLGEATLNAEGWAILDLTLEDGGHRIHVEAEDRARNQSSHPDAPIPGYESSTLYFGVDTLPPTVSILFPTGGTFLARRADGSSDDQDPMLPGMQIDVEVLAGASVGSVVEVLVDSSVVASAPVNDPEGIVTLRTTVPDGTRELSAILTTPGGNSGVSTPVRIFVDGAPPRLNLLRPAAHQVFRQSEGDDADPSAPGFQIEVELSYADIDPGQPVFIRSEESGTLLSTTAPPPEELSCPDDANRYCLKVTVNGGVQQLYAQARDASGNWGESARVPIEVELEGPSVWFASEDSPLRFGFDSAVNGVCQVQIAARSDLSAGQVELYSGGILLGSSALSSSGEGLIALEIPGNQQMELVLRAIDPQSQEGWSSPRTAHCDLSRPKLSFVNPKPNPSGEPVRYVAYGNPAGLPNVIEDKFPSPELEADFTLNVVGAIDGSLELWSDQDGLLAQRSIHANGQVLLGNVVLPTPGPHVLTAIARNLSGNEGSESLSISSDVQSPGPVHLPEEAQILHARSASLLLSFVAPGANQNTGDPVSGYLVRRSSSPIESESAWLSAEELNPEFDELVEPGEMQNLVIDELPFEKQHYLAVRAFDAAGNLGPLTPNAYADLRLSRQALAAPRSGTYVQVRQVVGDIDGDGHDDLIISSSVADDGQGAVYIYYGGSPSLGSPVVLKGSKNSSGQYLNSRFGSSLAVGDVNGDGLLDLLVGAEFEPEDPQVPSTKEGAIHVFLGAPNRRLSESSSADARIYGPPNSTALAGIGPQLSVVDDLSGDGIADIVIGSNFENGRKGRVHVVEGRPHWPSRLHTSTHDSNQKNVQLLDALAVLHTDWPLDFALSNGPSFGNRLASMGDLNSDGYGDFAIAASGGSFPSGVDAHRRVYVVSGKLARGIIAAEEISAIIPAPIARSQFGLALAAGDWNGDGNRDLAVAEAAGVRLYSGSSIAPHLPSVPANRSEAHNITQFTTLSLPGAGSAPVVVSNVGDMNGDGIDDIAASQVGPTGAINEVLLWKGRNSGSWGAANVLFPGLGRPNFGVDIRAGWLTDSQHRDLVILDLDSNVTVLSSP